MDKGLLDVAVFKNAFVFDDKGREKAKLKERHDGFVDVFFYHLVVSRLPSATMQYFSRTGRLSLSN